MQLRLLFLVLLIFLSLFLSAQSSPYPKYYFRNPLGIPMDLAANFGELRPNHWHMGLDIRTNQKENLPVYAAANGYIAHIGIRSQSFGRYIIINHPNGYSTLYGHLNDFFPALEEYVTQQQYEQETWAIELDMPKEKFPVYKSQFIAYSGNTGGSQGPHLHFEIRNTKTDRCINPLLFGLPVEDKVAPNLVKLAMYDRNYSVYEQTASFFLLKKTDSDYIIPKMPVIKTGSNKISFAIQAYDRTTGSTNPNGIYSAKLYFDDERLLSFSLDSISYEETVYENAQIDYKYRINGGPFLQHLSQLPGDHGIVYKQIKGDGTIWLADTAIHAVSIEVKDAYLNTSILNFSIQYDDSLAKQPTTQIPVNRFIPNQVNVLERPEFEMYLPETSLYDTIQSLYFRNNSSTPNAVTASHQVNDPSIPVHNDLTIRIKAAKPIPGELKNKIIIQRNYRSNNSVRKAELQSDVSTGTQWVSAKFDDFGIYQGFIDTEPPTLNELGSADTIDLSPATRIVFQPTDNFRVIKNFRAELDGKWLRFTNDKGWSYIYNFDEHCPYGIHELKVSIEDLVGNTITKSWWFKRYPYTPPKKKVINKKSKGKSPKTKSKKVSTKKK